MKKILVISIVKIPPFILGNQKCISEYCDLLTRMGYELHFLVSVYKNEDVSQMRDYWGDRLHLFYILNNNIWQKIKNRIRAKFIRLRYRLSGGYNHVDDFYPVGLKSFVEKLQDKLRFHAIIINYVTLSKVFEGKLSCKKIIYTHDCMSFKRLRYNMSSFWIDLKPNEEAKGLQRCDIVLSIQENESVYFKYLHPQGRIITVYSYFETHQQELTYNKNVLFLSGTSQLNVNGIKTFIRDVWPLVLEREPQATLIIGGSICKVIGEVKGSRVKIVGIKENLDDFYKLGDIAINPVYQGTGLKIKTFEAMSYGKVTIVHPHSAEGIYKPQEAPLLIGKTPLEFASHIVNALNNSNIRKEYALKGIKYIDSLNEYIEKQYRNVLDSL